jgi:hypothetical protein
MVPNKQAAIAPLLDKNPILNEEKAIRTASKKPTNNWEIEIAMIHHLNING